MPLKGFICPDGQKVEKEACLRTCRLDKRCYSLDSLAFLVKSANTGSSDGYSFPTCQQIADPPREKFLERTTPYYIRPSERVAESEGHKIHKQLGEVTGELRPNNKRRLKRHWQQPVAMDNIEPDKNNKGFFILTEIKTKRTISKITYSPRYEADAFKKETLCLNHYRIRLERQGKKISMMQIKCKARDKQGDIKILSVPKLPDEYVIAWFNDRETKLISYFNKKELPPPCSETDGYCMGLSCRVWRECDIGIEKAEAERERARGL